MFWSGVGYDFIGGGIIQCPLFLIWTTIVYNVLHYYFITSVNTTFPDTVQRAHTTWSPSSQLVGRGQRCFGYSCGT